MQVENRETPLCTIPERDENSQLRPATRFEDILEEGLLREQRTEKEGRRGIKIYRKTPQALQAGKIVGRMKWLTKKGGHRYELI